MEKSLRILLVLFAFVSFLNKNVQAQYCTPDYYYGPIWGDYLNGVELNTIYNYTAGGSEYNDYTDISTTLTPGDTYTLHLDNGPYWEYYQAWIDWNSNEEFEEDEKLLEEDYYIMGSGDDDIEFTVPGYAIPGDTRLRIVCVSYPSYDIVPCPGPTDYYYTGETEDYTISIPASGPYDLGVTDITSLATGCGLGSETVTVDLFNMGTEVSGTFTVAYEVYSPITGWAAPVVESYSGASIATLTGSTFSFSTPVDLSATGDYIIKAYTIYDLDGSAINDTTTINITSIPVITSYPYLEEYEAGSGGWTSYGSSSTWELGEPDGPVITGPPPTSPLSLNSWATNLTGYYEDYEDSYVEGPCFDFTSLVLPYVEFDIWYDTYAYTDGAQLEYSLDAGITWTLIGSVGSGDNWYTSTGYSLGYDPITFEYEQGWVGSSGGWLHTHHDLSFLAGEPQVKFRFRFESSYWPYYDGIAFDNFKVSQPYPDDLGVIDVVSPASTTTLTASEIVSVTVQNFGTNPQSDFTVYYRVDGGIIHSDVYSGTLNPGESGLLTFTDPEDFGAIGTYFFESWTALPGDYDITNDTLQTNVEHLTPVSGTDAYYIHHSTADPFGSSDNIDKMDEVFGEGGWTEEYFDTMNMDSVFSTNTCFIFLEGGEYTSLEFKDFLDNNHDAIENWVSAGGNLFLNAAPSEGGIIDYGFGGVTLNYWWYIYSATAIDPSFVIFNSPYTPVGSTWYGWWYNFATARVSGGDVTGIIKDTYYATYYALALKDWGEGTVLFGSMTPAEYHSPFDESSNLRLNILDFMKYCSPIDVGVVELISPDSSGCGLTDEEPITIEIQNFGATAISSFPVKVSVDGADPVMEIAVVDIAPGETGIYTFDYVAPLGALGLHTIEVWTDVYVDEDDTNDDLYLEIENLEAPTVDLGPDTTVCDLITLDAANPDMYYLWNTGETTQTIDATVAGDFSVAVTLPATGCVVSDTIHLDLNYTPAASFDAVISGLTVTFTNLSTPGALYTWYFGDGTYSNEFSPTHTFTPNAYTVVLVAENNCGYSYFDTILYVGVDPDDFDAINTLSLETRTVLYPNPTSNFLSVAMNFEQAYSMKFEVINMMGEVVKIEDAGVYKEGVHTLNVSDLPAGTYQLRISADENKFMKAFIIHK